MGGRNRSRTQRKHFKENRDKVWKRPKPDSEQQQKNSTPSEENGNQKPSWEPLIFQNPALEEYYKEQGIVAHEEWDTFINCLRSALPAAFRINSSTPFYKDIRMQLENDFMKSLQSEGSDGNEREAIRPLPWYPSNLGWHSEFSRKQLRKNQTLERFHGFLKLQNEIGNITRQEAVSMVPPLFLDVRPDHFVLDMCAAPGSKTFQLLETIHQLTESSSLPDGMVVANDVDIQRCNLLIHQTKRMCTANLIVTTHEAQHFPSCQNRNLNASDAGHVKKTDISRLLFDRVLCDVPCSGDGTLRKAPDIWRKWNPGMGNSLHGLQILIAMRGLALLKVGGRMVYSTCSMNPVENEAVVAEILRRCKGSVELLDVSTELPMLIRRPGLKKWKVQDKGLWFCSYKDVPENRRAAFVPCMFPSGRTFLETSEHDQNLDTNAEKFGNEIQSEDGAEDVSTLPLERCMRIVPHDQNTGAFFIAVLHKISALPAVENKTSKHTQQSSYAQVQKETADVIEDKTNVNMNVDDITDDQVSEADISVPVALSSVSLRNDEIVEASLDSDPSNASEKDTAEASLDSDPSVASETNAAKDIWPSNANKSIPETVGEKRKLQTQGRWVGLDPVLFYKEETVISNIKEFYGIKDSFPFLGHLVTRNSDTSHVKRIYYVSNAVKKVLELNILAGQQLKIASVGLKMFERQTSKEGTASPCSFRISSEGLPLILPYITKQILYASPADFKHLLQYKSIKFGDFTDVEFRNKASELFLGCCIVVLNKENKASPDHHEVDSTAIAIGCWRGKNSVSVMVTAVDCQELLERLSFNSEKESTPNATC